MQRFVSIVVSPLFYLYTLFYFTVFLLLTLAAWLLTAWWDRSRKVVHFVLSSWCYIFISLNPVWRLRVEGREKIPLGGCVFAPNHQHLFDIMLLYCLMRPFKWVAKRQLFHAPFVGWILGLGDYVSIDRGSASDSRRMMAECVRWLKRGVSIMIFPEGTRSASGRVGRFKTGAAMIAKMSGKPLVPLAISGSRLVQRGLLIRFAPFDLRIEVLEPISAEEVSLLEVQDLTERLHEAVLAAHGKLESEVYEGSRERGISLSF